MQLSTASSENDFPNSITYARIFASASPDCRTYSGKITCRTHCFGFMYPFFSNFCHLRIKPWYSTILSKKNQYFFKIFFDFRKYLQSINICRAQKSRSANNFKHFSDKFCHIGAIDTGSEDRIELVSCICRGIYRAHHILGVKHRPLRGVEYKAQLVFVSLHTLDHR